MEDSDSHFCRLCLTSSVVYYSLLINNGKEMVLSLIGLEIDNDDPSTDCCTKCWLDLKLAFFIQQCFIEAEKKLGTTPYSEFKIVEINGKSTEELTEIGNTDDNLKAKTNYNNVEVSGNVSEDNGDKYHEQSHKLIYVEPKENVEEKPSICAICGLECKDEVLYNHINIHYNEPLQCDECLVSIQNISVYRSHLQVKHPKIFEATYICGICSLSFKYKPLYNLHLNGFHLNTAKTGRIKNVFTLPTLEGNDSPFKCEQCKKIFTNKKSHDAHMDRIHHNKSICPICGERVARFHSHIVTHKGNPVKCDICGKTFKNIECLKKHKYCTHKNLKKWTCEECGKQFKKLCLYILHIKYHKGEKNFACVTCDKRYVVKSKLNRHYKLKHSEKHTHTCNVCNLGFATKDVLLAHEKKHSNELS